MIVKEDTICLNFDALTTQELSDNVCELNIRIRIRSLQLIPSRLYY